jgi:hypothetical protein
MDLDSIGVNNITNMTPHLTHRAIERHLFIAEPAVHFDSSDLKNSTCFSKTSLVALTSAAAL